jgi:hypothetical protein
LRQFYADKTGGAPVPKELQKLEPEVRFTQSISNDLVVLAEGGYDLLGFSEYWTSKPPTVQDLKKKGKEVGASVVLCYTEYRETVTQYQPMFNYVPGTTATYNSSGTVTAQGNATVQGKGWTGYGTSTATGYYSSSASASTPGYTEYAGSMPYNVRLYNVGAVFCRAPTGRGDSFTPTPSAVPEARQEDPTATSSGIDIPFLTKYQPMVDKGDAWAQYMVGAAYVTGTKLPQNHAEGTRLLQKAANQGVQQAQALLAAQCNLGRGTPASKVEAFKWASLAAAQGNGTAAELRDWLKARMTEEELNEASRMVAEFTARKE